MDIKELLQLTVTVLAVCASIFGALRSAWRWAKAEAKDEILREQAKSTIEEKNRELADLEVENERLWTLLQEKSQ